MPRAPLDVAVLRARLPARWMRLEVVEQTGSTNADLLAGSGPDALRVLVAEHQSEGRGRLDRGWSSPPRAGLLFSVRVRPDVGLAQWGWLPLLSGLALAEAVQDRTGVATALKWPNDLLAAASGAKLAGVLAQTTGPDAVVGVGLNVDTQRAELPVPTAGSLALEGASEVDRTELLAAILDRLDDRLTAWAAAAGDAEASGIAAAYRARCVTLGSDVRVDVEGSAPLLGTARDVDDTGRLVLATAHGEQRIGAGDVTHVRPAPG
ncbi:biotin--[acetyl-CoA-carboxylase] ligase [uncultured Jatrophihabitans sp.]|uniref:biotin--[acetyl-CoA-carboxylase] ligase n=1 Tax=uncultured Jatrophihabitans sp. TaxID=1610747 RepID=UPI0035CA8FE5